MKRLTIGILLIAAMELTACGTNTSQLASSDVTITSSLSQTSEGESSSKEESNESKEASSEEELSEDELSDKTSEEQHLSEESKEESSEKSAESSKEQQSSTESSKEEQSSSKQETTESVQSSTQEQSSEQHSSEPVHSSETVTEVSSTEPIGSSEDRPVLPEIDYIKVFCPAIYTHIYAWTESASKVTELLGGWPGSGTALKEYNENWKYYDFDHSLKEVNFIFNIPGAGQTADLKASGYGYYWYHDGKVENVNQEPEISGGGGTSWHGKEGNIYIEPEGYTQPTDLPTPTYTVVDSASSYSDLPAVKNYAGSGQVVNKYKGSRTDFRDESIYFAITTRFYDGDKSNNTHCWDAKNDATDDPNWRGDFKGLIEKMDYIKALGFTSIWITPVVKNASGFDYHGYHAINFKEVDPRYESEDVAFQDVINEAHKRDMKIILDVVFNHTCNFGEENLFPMFYYDAKHNTSFNGMVRYPKNKGGILPDSYDKTNNPGQMRFDYLKTETGDPTQIYHHDPDGSLSWEQYSEQTGQIAGDCVDLNTENPTVANYLVEAYAKFIEMGVDAFRIDTEKHISRLTLNKYYWPAFKEIARKARGDDNFHMFGEVCVKDTDVWNRGQQSDSVPFYTWAETKNYAWGTKETNAASAKQHWSDYLMPTNAQTTNNAYLNGVTYHAPNHSLFSGNGVIDFPMHWNFNNARNSFGVATNKDKYYNDSTYNVVYVDSHDYSPNEGQDNRFDGGTNAWKENMSLMFTFRGVPCLFYGSEIEFQHGKRIDNGPNLALANSGRAYYGDNIEGNLTATGFGSYSNASGKVATTLNSTLSKHLQKLNKARLSCIALRRGQYTTSNVSGSGMAFTRRYTANGTDSVAAVCISGNAYFTNLPNGTYKDLYGGSTYNVTNGTLSANASGQGTVQIWAKQ